MTELGELFMEMKAEVLISGVPSFMSTLKGMIDAFDQNDATAQKLEEFNLWCNEQSAIMFPEQSLLSGKKCEVNENIFSQASSRGCILAWEAAYKARMEGRYKEPDLRLKKREIIKKLAELLSTLP